MQFNSLSYTNTHTQTRISHKKKWKHKERREGGFGGEVWREAANERKRVRESEREEGERERFKR